MDAELYSMKLLKKYAFSSYISELGKPKTTVRGTSLHSFPQKERLEVFKLLGWVSISSEQES